MDDKKVIIESKVQTIYYENSIGEIKKHHEFNENRLNLTEAENLLKELGLNVNIVLRVLTERVEIEFSREELEERIINSERFYNTKN